MKAPKFTGARAAKVSQPRTVGHASAHPGALAKRSPSKGGGGFGYGTVKAPKASPFSWKPTKLGGRGGGKRGK